MFPREEDPRGEPETWTADQLRRWLTSVSGVVSSKVFYEVAS